MDTNCGHDHGTDYTEWLETNLREAIRALHSERYRDFTPGLLELLSFAKHSDRMTHSMLGVHAGRSAYEENTRVNCSEKKDEWY